MTLQWFRLYHALPNDRKLRKFTSDQKWAWVVLLCLASESGQRGLILNEDEDDIADYCGFTSVQDYRYFLDKLRQKGMIEPIEGGLKIINWEKRQYIKPSDKPEATRDRKRRQRARQKAEKEQAVTRDNCVTARDVTPPDQIRTDPDPDLSPPTSSQEIEKSKQPRESDLNDPFWTMRLRRPISVPVTPIFQGPWGTGRTPLLDEFEAKLIQEGKTKRKEDPSAYAFKVIDSIVKGGPIGKWKQLMETKVSHNSLEKENKQLSEYERIRQQMLLEVQAELGVFNDSTSSRKDGQRRDGFASMQP